MELVHSVLTCALINNLGDVFANSSERKPPSSFSSTKLFVSYLSISRNRLFFRRTCLQFMPKLPICQNSLFFKSKLLEFVKSIEFFFFPIHISAECAWSVHFFLSALTFFSFLPDKIKLAKGKVQLHESILVQIKTVSQSDLIQINDRENHQSCWLDWVKFKLSQTLRTTEM